MKINLIEYEKEVAAGYISKTEHNGMFLFNYTPHCQYEKHWNSITRLARCLIVDSSTGEIESRCLGKFFNIGEREETLLINLPKEEYVVTEKMDGSYVQTYWDNSNECADIPVVSFATRGSFTSEQALEAMAIKDEKYKKLTYSNLNPNICLAFEVLYPSNRLHAGARLVIDYGDVRDIILLAGYNKSTMTELTRQELEELADSLELKIVHQNSYTIGQMIELQKTLPVTQEGFVIHYPSSGLRVKIKGSEYLRMSKLLNSYSPISVWEALEHGNLPDKYLMNVPEEIRLEIVQYEFKLNERYCALHSAIRESMKPIPKNSVPEITPSYRKVVATWLKENKHPYPSMVFPYVLGREDAIEKFVLDSIRPTANVL